MSREIEYAPEPKKLVPWSKLQEILAKRCPVTLSEEIWFASKLRSFGVADVFAGDTTRDVRRERVRAAVLAQNLGQRVCGKRKGKDATVAELFSVVYGCSL
jgi:hypothetical protein